MHGGTPLACDTFHYARVGASDALAQTDGVAEHRSLAIPCPEKVLNLA
jgi:hypothetical protein